MNPQEQAIQEQLRLLKQNMAALNHSNRAGQRTAEFLAVEIETLEWVLSAVFKVAPWTVVFPALMDGYLAPDKHASDRWRHER